MAENENEKIPDLNNKTGETEQEFHQGLIDNLETAVEKLWQLSDQEQQNLLSKIIEDVDNLGISTEKLRQLSNKQQNLPKLLERAENLIRRLRITFGLPPPKPKTIH